MGPEIEFDIVRGATPTMVVADPAQIEQIVLNLVVNARDAMPGGGRLTVTIEEVDVDQVAALAEIEGGGGRYARVSVSDTGTGIDERTRVRLFEPFFTTKEEGKGTGLGLSIVTASSNKTTDSSRWRASRAGARRFSSICRSPQPSSRRARPV